jgi:WD40 repeat protein
VVTGGLDACVCRWENHKSVPVTKWNITRLVGEHAEREAAAEAEAEGTDVASRVSPSQMMNPPFVHCVATWSCKSDPSVPHVRRIAAAACGDGTVALLDLDAGGSDKKSKKEKNSKKKANENFPPCAFLGRGELGTPHATATSHVCFPGWGDGEILVSGGNDRVIKIWRWGRAFGNGVLGPEPQPNQSECNPMEHSFLHGRKVNWVAHSDSRAAAPGGGHVFVCDTSEKITGYVVT